MKNPLKKDRRPIKRKVLGSRQVGGLWMGMEEWKEEDQIQLDFPLFLVILNDLPRIHSFFLWKFMWMDDSYAITFNFHPTNISIASFA